MPSWKDLFTRNKIDLDAEVDMSEEEEAAESEAPSDEELATMRALLAKYGGESTSTEKPTANEESKDDKSTDAQVSSEAPKPEVKSSRETVKKPAGSKSAPVTTLDSVISAGPEAIDKAIADGSLEKMFNQTVSR